MNQLFNDRFEALVQPHPEICDVALYVTGAPSVFGAQSVVGISQTQESSHANLPQWDSKK